MKARMKESVLYASRFFLLKKEKKMNEEKFFMFTSTPWSVVKEEAEVDGNRRKI